MRLTREKAISIAIELWEWCAETGGEKGAWPGWGKYETMWFDCPLCEYDDQAQDMQDIEEDAICRHCPYYKKFGNCDADDTPYARWHYAISLDKQQAAKELLAQLKELQ